MRTTKTEDLIRFDVSKEEITFHVTFYMAGAMLIVKKFHAKTRRNLKKQIRSYLDVQWPVNKDKISYQIR